MIMYVPTWNKCYIDCEILLFVLKLSCIAANRAYSLTAGKQSGIFALSLTFREEEHVLNLFLHCVITARSVLKIPRPSFGPVSLIKGGIRKEIRSSRAEK